MADDGALTLDKALSSELRQAAHEGSYRSPEEVVREALAEWKTRREDPAVRLARLKALIQEGLDDIAAGRIVDLDVDDIAKRGRERLAQLRG